MPIVSLAQREVSKLHDLRRLSTVFIMGIFRLFSFSFERSPCNTQALASYIFGRPRSVVESQGVPAPCAILFFVSMDGYQGDGQ